MDGDGHFSRRMHPISRSLPATKGIAWVVMFQLSQPTGYTYKATRSSNRNSQQTLIETRSQKFNKENCSEEVSIANHRWNRSVCHVRMDADRESCCSSPAARVERRL